MEPADSQDDPPLDAEDLEAVAVLTPDDFNAIDQALLTTSSTSWRKVAAVVGTAMDAYPDFYKVPDVFYAQRVRALVADGKLEARGNLYRMRFSEVRLPQAR